MKDTSFESTDLTGALFTRTKLTNVDFRGANLTNVDLTCEQVGNIKINNATVVVIPKDCKKLPTVTP